MTQTLDRPRGKAAAAPDPVPSLVPVAALGAAAAAGLGLLCVGVVVLLTWVSASGTESTALQATRVAASGWLLAHRVPLHLPAGTLALPPLGLTALPVLFLVRCGGWIARTAHITTRLRAAEAVIAMAASYGVLLGLVAGAAAGAVSPSTIGALLAGWTVAVLAGGVGILRGAGLLTRVWGDLPLRIRAVATSTTACLVALVAGGAVVVTASLLWHADRALHLAQALDAGLVGGAALLMLSLAYLPTAAVWGAAYALGTGFAVGVGTSVGPFATHLGAVPALPLLAGLPESGSGPGVGVYALLIPFAAAVCGGVVLGRQGSFDTPERAALWGLLLGPCGGAGVVLLCWLSGGPAGPGRFTDVGPSPWQAGIAACLEFAVAGAVGAWEGRRRLGT